MHVPKLRFKDEHGQEYPEWKVSKLGELFNVSAGGDIDGNNVRSVKTQDFCYPVYANALKNKGLYGYSNTYKIDGESFTITGRGDVGVAVSRHCNYTPIVRLLVCKPLHNENVDFFAECFNKTKVFIESTGVPQLTAPQVKNIKITYPSLSEQEKIANFLTTVDRQIDIQSQRVETMKTRKKGLLQKIFSQEIRFKDDEGREFPEWEKKTVGSLANNIVGGGTPSTKNPAFYAGEIPWISSSDLVEDKIKYLNMTRFITQDAINRSATKLIPAQSVMIVCRVGVGKVAVNELPLCTSQDFMNLIVKEENSPVFIGYLLMNLMVKRKNSVQGTAIKGIPSAEIKKFKVLVPALPEQQKIADFLTTVDDQIDVEEKRLETMKTIKKGLLQQMFI